MGKEFEGTLYDRGMSGKPPAGAGGYVNIHGPQAGQGHSTQWYEDNTRASWDHSPQGDGTPHWTDQSIPKGQPGRHTPPPHAR